MGDVTIKVSIARKQPMLEAATGKSVWATLGKYQFWSNTDRTNKQCMTGSVNSGFMYTFSFPSQLCRTVPKVPTETRETRLCTVRISYKLRGVPRIGDLYESMS